MASLPIFQNNDRDLQLLQTRWKSLIDPLLASPLATASILSGVVLATGPNVVNHLLGRRLVGWTLVRQRAAASIYDTQDANQTPQLTLQLTSSANVVVDILVF